MQVKVIKKIDGKLYRRTGKVITDRLRVCAYCRVSTGDEEQINSYESQKNIMMKKLILIHYGYLLEFMRMRRLQAH